MQAQLPLMNLSAAAAMPAGVKPTAPKPGAEEEFAGLLLASANLAGQATPATGETVAFIAGTEENPDGGSAQEEAAPDEGEAAIGSPISPDLRSSLSAAPAAAEVEPNLPAGTQLPVAKVSPQAADVEPLPTTGSQPAPGAEVGFAGTVTVENAPAAPVATTAAAQVGTVVQTEPGTIETGTGTVANAEGFADGTEPTPQTAESVLPATSGSAQVTQKVETGKQISRPLEVADVLALKARHLRRLAAQGVAAKPTYEDPRLSGERSPASVKPQQLPSLGQENRILAATSENVSGKVAVPVTAAPVDGVQILQNSQNPQTSQTPQAAVVADPELAAPAQEQPSLAASAMESKAEPEGSKGQEEETPGEGKPAPQAVPLTIQVARQAATSGAEHTPAPSTPTEHAGSGKANSLNQASSVVEGVSTRTAAPIFKQVVENIDMQSTGSSVKIQLNPEHLGRVEVSLLARGNVLEVRIVADNPQAAQSLQGNLHELTEGLKEKAVQFQHLDVQVESRETVRIKPEDGQQGRRDQQRGQERQGGDGRQDGSRERGRREHRSGSGLENQGWSWFDMKEEA